MSQKKIKKDRSKWLFEKEVVEPKVTWPGFGETFKRYWKFVLFLVVLATGFYWNSLAGAFVSDDYATITQNPAIVNFGEQLKGLNSMNILNSAIASVFGVSSPVPFHVFSTLLYLTILVLAYLFTVRVFGEIVGAVGGLIFALMPVHVEAVSWISGKPYLIVALFFFISINLFITYLSSEKKKYLWWWIVVCIIGFWAEKVRFPATFFLTGLFLWCFDPERIKKINWGKIITIGTPVAIVALIVLWPMIQERVNSVNSGYNQSDSIFYNPFFQYPTAMAKYLQLLFLPLDLTLYHTMFDIPAWLNWMVLLTYVGLLIVTFKNNRKMFFALLFIFGATAPSMAPVKVSWLVAERYVFLGSYGFALVLALLAEKYYKNMPAITFGLVGLYMVFGGVFTYWRNIDWQSNHNLWVRTVQVSPNSHNAWNNIGDDYDKLGQYDNAIKGFGKSYEVKPNYADAYHNQANIFFKTGRLDLARWAYDRALTYSPQLFQTYLSLTQIDIAEKKADLALQHSQTAVQLQPNNPTAHYVYGIALAQAGHVPEAKAQFQMLLQAIPNYQPALDALKQLNVQSGS